MKYTDEQSQAILTDHRRVCVDAGAGSGKTRILVDRIVALLGAKDRWPDGHPRLDRIVAFTFMEKAAAEMKARLRKAFRQQAMEYRQEASRWREFERNVDSARVSTIHAFCAAFLRENALHLGIDPDIGVMDETNAALLAQDTISATLHRLLEENHAGAVHLAVTLGLGALRTVLKGILKRRGLFLRLAGLLPHDNPEALSAAWAALCAEEELLRYKAFVHSREIKHILRNLEACGGFCQDPEESREQRRALAAGLFRSFASGQATPASTQHQRETLIASGWKKANGIPWTDATAYKQAETAVGQAKEFVKKLDAAAPENGALEVEIQAAVSTCALVAVATEVITAHGEAMRAMNVMDYEDMIALTRKALRENTDLRQRTARGMAFLLIDEFQDTDHAQLEIALMLAEEDSGPALFVVGDAKQSVYLFRGAEVEVFSEQKNYPGGATIPLRTNFRSLPDVLWFVNDLFRQSGALSAVEDYQDLAAHRAPQGGGHVEIFVPENTGAGKWNQEQQTAAEADFIAQRIREMVDGPNPLQITDAHTGDLRPARYGDMAILFRRNTHAYLYEEALRRAQTPYCRSAGSGFYERQEILDLIFLLKAVTDPWDEAALLGFLRGPMACLSDDAILRLRMQGGVARVFHSDLPPEEMPQALTQARNLVAALQAQTLLPPGEFLRRALDLTHYEAILLGQYQGLQKVSNLRKLIAAADAFARSRPAGLRAFVAFVDDARDGVAREGEANLQTEGGNAVVLLTVHKSKGLEFPIVFLPDTSSDTDNNKSPLVMHRRLGLALKTEDDQGEKIEGLLAQAIKLRAAREEEAESARTLYVALTRARDYLVICGNPKPDKGSWFALIDETFPCVGKPHGTVLSGHERRWSAVIKHLLPSAAAPSISQKAHHAFPEDLARRIAPLTAVSAAQRTFSVSLLLNLLCDAQEPDENEEGTSAAKTDAAEAASDRDYAMARGTLAHRLFELWDFAASPPDLKRLVAESQMDPTRRPGLETGLESMTRLFRAHKLFPMLRDDNELQRELPFHLAVGPVIIRGTIDALLGNGIVLDYKTGRPNEEKAERYALQLALYAAAVRAITGVTPPEGWLYYVDLGELVPIPLTGTQIDETLRRAEAAITCHFKLGA